MLSNEETPLEAIIFTEMTLIQKFAYTKDERFNA